MIHDNDSLAAHLAAEVGADLLILMSDVDGVYNLPPGAEGSRLLSTFSPRESGMVQFGQLSKVGTGGMESKVFSAAWALERGVSVIICNGADELAVSKVMAGKPCGTFFTDAKQQHVAVETLAANCKLAWWRKENCLLNASFHFRPKGWQKAAAVDTRRACGCAH